MHYIGSCASVQDSCCIIAIFFGKFQCRMVPICTTVSMRWHLRRSIMLFRIKAFTRKRSLKRNKTPAAALTQKYFNFTFFATPENSFDTACASNFWPIWRQTSPIKFKSLDCRTHIWLIILLRLKTRRGLISGKCLVRILPTNPDDDPKKSRKEVLRHWWVKQGSLPDKQPYLHLHLPRLNKQPHHVFLLHSFPFLPPSLSFGKEIQEVFICRGWTCLLFSEF